MKNKKDKVDLLTEEMREGFRGIDRKFDGVDVRFDGVEARFEGKFEDLVQIANKGFQGIEERMVTKEDFALEIGKINDRLDGLEKEMRGMHQNFDAVFLEFKELRNEIKEVDTRAEVIDLQVRVDKLEKKVRTK